MAPGFQKSKAALAHAARLKVMVVSSSDPDSSDSDNCHWDGTEGDKVPQLFETFNHHNIICDGSDTEWGCEDGPLPLDNESSESDQDLEGLELLRSFALAGNNDEASIVTAYQAIIEYKSEKNWKEAEKKLKGPYTGNSERSQQRNDKKLRDKEEEDKISRTSAATTSFKSMFVVLPQTLPSNPSVAPVPVAVQATTPLDTTLLAPFIATPPNVSAISAPVDEIFTGYISDISSGDSDEPMREGQDQTSGMDSADEIIAAKAVANLGEEPLGHRVQPVPALRHTKLGIPQAEHHHIAMAQAATARANILASALTEIDKLIASKKDIFHAGSLSLQSYRVRAIQSHHMVVQNRKSWKPASETAADAQGFAMQWGGRKVRKWTCSWISDRVIPESQRGKHGKSYSLYDDPVICAKLRSYVRSEKWASSVG
ncbi:hypothetical protein B0H10DRAFT_2241436 [Mycena sp. CBHHK59/15]|nr:hypothetical protein B0H10DRAFT_2241436 [Mycena sp. CBHHK59/15]